ncbi:hypothetical protein B0H11DRAFT_2183315 [Mycena galericulata]|nr:hypothetical protein B0H11DRAFT_2183315 [Mycena galericulata]
MAHKAVHWKLTVDEYAAHDSPESWTSPLPHSALPVPAPPPPTPNPQALVLHPALSPGHALQLDLSFPSEAFRSNPQLTQALLSAPACNPPRREIHVLVAAGALRVRLQVMPRGNPGTPVTVGDILTTVQTHLRQYDEGKAPVEAERYMRRRIATVNGYCAGGARSQRIQAQNVEAERQGRGRIVDHLLGNTQFSGLALERHKPDHHWELKLAVPARYTDRR